ncbi:hypothetical protein L0Y46_00330 [bacterium]|nr:hypothetical protein [bacterium]MCI0680377.1 hypothetical protein [bacterium]
MEKNTNKKYNLVAIVVAFIVGFFVGLDISWILGDKEDARESKTASTTEDIFGSIPDGEEGEGMMKNEEGSQMTGGEKKPSSVMVSGGFNITVGDQFPGRVVTLPSVEVGKDSWVSIREDNPAAPGTPGSILGASRFRAGTYTDASIELLRGTTEGGTYYATIHADDGDDEFNYEKDLPFAGSDGKELTQAFRVSTMVE